MKLCRFDLVTSPGTPRSGIVYEGKVYETDGSNPVGVHDWSEARLLSPVGQPSSFRLFPAPTGLEFRYLNPGVILGPHASVLPSEGAKLTCIPCLGAVVAGGGSVVPISEADGLVLGLTLVNVFIHYDGDSPDPSTPTAWALDAGAAVGPALTTPDELDDTVEDESTGRRYGIPVSLQINGETVWSGNTNDLHSTIAETLGHASLTARLRQGDLIAVALPSSPLALNLDSGCQIKLISEKLGTLVTKVT